MNLSTLLHTCRDSHKANERREREREGEKRREREREG